MIGAYVIGDTQSKPGVKNPLIAVAWDIVDRRPPLVVHMGDHHDMPSLSAYDKAKFSFHSRRYINDINAGNQAFYEFWSIIAMGRALYPTWKCKFVYIKGNHCDRIRKAMEDISSEYQGLMEHYQPDYTGWDVVKEFLDPFVYEGVAFVHYLANEFSGRPISSARLGLSRKHCSFVCGHKQTLDYAEEQTIDGRRILGLIIGACYYHDEEYKGKQGNGHFRGCAILNNLKKGQYDLEIRNLKTLESLYDS